VLKRADVDAPAENRTHVIAHPTTAPWQLDRTDVERIGLAVLGQFRRHLIAPAAIIDA
jgi:hypothetical protein